jgi:hypothetical protein
VFITERLDPALIESSYRRLVGDNATSSKSPEQFIAADLHEASPS